MSGKRKTRTGTVTSTKMQKTVVVAVENVQRHPLYNKILRNVRRFKAHDEKQECKLGDRVKIVETRPLSKDKRWRVAEIVTRAELAEIQPSEIKEEIEQGASQESRSVIGEEK
ncbi:MAG: 30S ribosomal protein S17 [Chloroflexi bacterium]|nr:30S ribosomal protein S17 [Chloroflexota bacterium]